MTIEEITVSKELADRLLGIGLKWPSIFHRGRLGSISKSVGGSPAWTGEELLLLLPVGVKVKIEGQRKALEGTMQIRWRPLLRDKPGNLWTVDYDRFQADMNVEAGTFPDAVALMILKLTSLGLLAYPVDPVWARKNPGEQGSMRRGKS